MSPELILLVADKNMEAAMDALLGKRKRSLSLKDFSYEIHVHPRRDPGCYQDGAALLCGLLGGGTRHGLMVFDFTWDGNPHSNAADTEEAVREKFRQCGIEGRAEVVSIEPELEAWVWSASQHVEEILGWRGSDPDLRSWLRNRELWSSERIKPENPKKALEEALYEKRIPRSSSIYRQLAETVGLRGCQDASFSRVIDVLRRWFPEERGDQ